MAELGLVLVGFVCGAIFGVFMAAVIAASSDRDNRNISTIEKIRDNGMMYVDEDLEIVDKLEDGRYLVIITSRK